MTIRATTPYQGGTFIVFHGSWNRAPLPQGGYNVVFVPFTGAEPTTGDYEIFADGFAGQVPLMERDDATYRPSGLPRARTAASTSRTTRPAGSGGWSIRVMAARNLLALTPSRPEPSWTGA